MPPEHGRLGLAGSRGAGYKVWHSWQVFCVIGAPILSFPQGPAEGGLWCIMLCSHLLACIKKLGGVITNTSTRPNRTSKTQNALTFKAYFVSWLQHSLAPNSTWNGTHILVCVFLLVRKYLHYRAEYDCAWCRVLLHKLCWGLAKFPYTLYYSHILL